MPQKSVDDIFHELTLKRGGRLNLDLLEPQPRDVFLHFKNRAQQSIIYAERVEGVTKRVPIHFDFIMNPCIGALSFVNDQDHIGIHHGSILILLHAFFRMLAHPKIAPDVGDIGKEEWYAPLPNKGATYRLIRAPSDLPGMGDAIPKDPVRLSYAWILASTAFDFLFAHELCHLRHGHVDLKKILESENRFDVITSQTLEMDADAGAVQLCVEQAFCVHEELDRILGQLTSPDDHAAFKLAYQTPRDTLITCVIAICMLFRICDDEFWNLDRNELHPHNPTPLRRNWAIATIDALLERPHFRFSQEDLRLVMPSWAAHVELAYAWLTGGDLLADGYNAVNDARSQEHSRKVMEQWKMVRPQLESLKRGGQLAPIDNELGVEE